MTPTRTWWPVSGSEPPADVAAFMLSGQHAAATFHVDDGGHPILRDDPRRPVTPDRGDRAGARRRRRKAARAARRSNRRR